MSARKATKIFGNFTDFKIFQSSGKIVFHNWETPGSVKTLSADVLFNNPRIKILSIPNINLECLNFDSKKTKFDLQKAEERAHILIGLSVSPAANSKSVCLHKYAGI